MLINVVSCDNSDPGRGEGGSLVVGEAVHVLGLGICVRSQCFLFDSAVNLKLL